MPPRLIPDRPLFASAAEELACNALMSVLPDDVTILAGVRIWHDSRPHEVDLFVIWPGMGVAICEVKGGLIDVEEGQWFTTPIRRLQGQRRIPLRVSPVAQVEGSKFAFAGVLSNVSNIKPRQVPTLVLLPDSTLSEHFSVLDLPRAWILDQQDLDEPLPALRRAFEAAGGPLLHFGAAEAVRLIEALLTNHHAVRHKVLFARNLTAEADWLSQQQTKVASLLDWHERAHIIGGAGSGKTHMAVSMVREGAAAGLRWAYLSYSEGLAQAVAHGTFGPVVPEHSTITTFHALAEELSGATRQDFLGSDDGYFEHFLPSRLRQAVQRLDSDAGFDLIVVDEGQDFGEAWWGPIEDLLALRGGRLRVFSDPYQKVFDRVGEVGPDLPAFPLSENLRNSARIARAIAPMVPVPQDIRLPEGPVIRWVPVIDRDEVLEASDAQVRQLLEEGWPPGSIALLATGHRHPEHRAVVESAGKEAYWAQVRANSTVTYGHVLGFKGLESDAVVLAMNGDPSDNFASARLYAGLSRARTQLVVVGTRDDLRELGGPEVFAGVTVGGL